MAKLNEEFKVKKTQKTKKTQKRKFEEPIVKRKSARLMAKSVWSHFLIFIYLSHLLSGRVSRPRAVVTLPARGRPGWHASTEVEIVELF